MATNTPSPRVTIRLSTFHAYFRFDRTDFKLFHDRLCLVRKEFPHMLWIRGSRMWQLPICDLKSLYEFCRKFFGVENIEFQRQQYRDRPRCVQLNLFDSGDN